MVTDGWYLYDSTIQVHSVRKVCSGGLSFHTQTCHTKVRALAGKRQQTKGGDKAGVGEEAPFLHLLAPAIAMDKCLAD